MKKLLVFLFVLVSTQILGQAITPYEKGLVIVRQSAVYTTTIIHNPDNQLVDLELEIPGIILDIRYATTNNFTGEQIYTQPKAFVRKPVAKALKQVQNKLAEKGLGLLIYDAYRPYAATVKFYEVYRDTTFVASPYFGSRHNRGAAVDVSLVDLQTGLELEMPTTFDNFSDTAAPNFPNISDIAKMNRTLLIEVMQAHGFKVYHSEWWHFDYQGWDNFDLMDLSFEQLEKVNNNYITE